MMSCCFIDSIHSLPKKFKRNPVRWVFESGNIQDKNHILSSMIASNWGEMTTSSLQSNNNKSILFFLFFFQKMMKKQPQDYLLKKDVIITPV